MAFPKFQAGYLYLLIQQPVHPKAVLLQTHLHLPVIIDGQFRGCRRRRRPQVGRVIGNGGVRLMPHCRDYRNAAFEDRPGHFLFVKGPQVFNGAASASHDHHIHSVCFQHPDSTHDALLGAFPLHLGRIKNQLDIGIAASGNIHDVPHCRSGGRGDNANSACKGWDRLFVFRCKHPHLFQFFFQHLEFLIEKPISIQPYLFGIQLVGAASLIHIYRAQDHDLLALAHTKRESASLPGKHDAGNRSGLIF